jgi:hypothetical protein
MKNRSDAVSAQPKDHARWYAVPLPDGSWQFDGRRVPKAVPPDQRDGDWREQWFAWDEEQ